MFNALNAIYQLYILMDHACIVQIKLLDALHVKYKMISFIALHVKVIIISRKEVVYLVTLQMEYAMHALIIMDIVKHALQP